MVILKNRPKVIPKSKSKRTPKSKSKVVSKSKPKFTSKSKTKVVLKNKIKVIPRSKPKARPKIRRNKTSVDFFNSIKGDSEIIKRIKNNRLNQSGISKDADKMLRSLAKIIIAKRNRLPRKKFKSLSHISKTTGIESNILTDIYRGSLPNIVDHPAILFPVRLETKYIENELLVRIYPDQIAIESLQHRSSDNDEESREEDEEPKFRTLPDRFVVSLYKKSGEQLFKWKKGMSIPDELPVMCDPDKSFSPIRYFGNEDRVKAASKCWMHDFQAAEEVGMAVRFENISLEDFPLARIVAVGIKNKKTVQESQLLLEKLLESHRYNSGFSFLKHGTPTNNTSQVSTEYSEKLDTKYAASSSCDAEVTNAQCLQKFLGFRDNQASFLHELENANIPANLYDTRVAKGILWQATGDYFFRKMLSGVPIDNRLELLKDHFKNYVDARGMFPAIRIGNNPYGILPVSNYHRWQPSILDSLRYDGRSINFNQNLHRVLGSFYDKWKDMSKTVPLIDGSDDPDKELLSILSMHPNSCSIGVRAVVDEKLSRWLLDNINIGFFGLSDSDRESWYNECWENNRRKTLGILKQLAPRIGEKVLTQSFILNILNWGDAWIGNYELVRDNNNPEDPLLYLKEIDKIIVAPKTILYNLLTRSLINIEEVKDDLEKIYNRYQDDVEGLEQQLLDVLDLNTYRLDAWITSLANRRLYAMREAKPSGVVIGAYGFLENFSLDKNPNENGGFIHAPSVGQAATGAILRNAYMAHKEDGEGGDLFRINLSSDRVRNAKRIVDGIREGQELGALLGYQFERYLHDKELDKYIYGFRDEFPLKAGKGEVAIDDSPKEAVAARNVVDGVALATKWQEDENAISKITDNKKVKTGIDQLVDLLDAVKDLLMYEGVFQSVQGNFERSGAILDALSGHGRPPEIEGIKTPVSGRNLKHQFCMLLPTEVREERDERSFDPRIDAEPKLQTWLENLFLNNDLSKLNKIGCVAVVNEDDHSVNLESLGIGLIDFLYLSASIPEESAVAGDTEIEQRIKYFVRSKIDNFTDKIDIKIDWQRTGITDDSGNDVGLSMYEALIIGKSLLNLLGKSRSLKPDSLTFSEGNDSSDNYLLEVYNDLKSRIEIVLNKLINLRDEQDFTPEWFLQAAKFGIAEAIPELPLYLFDWNKFPGEDNEKVVEFCKNELNLEWIEKAKIIRSDDGEKVSFVYEESLIVEDLPEISVKTIEIAFSEDEKEIKITDIEKEEELCTLFVHKYEKDDKDEIKVFLHRIGQHKLNIDKKINKRVDLCDQLLEQATGNDYKKIVDNISCTLKEVFGQSFIVLPQFKLNKDISDAIKYSDDQFTALNGSGQPRINLWLQQAAQTHSALQSFEEVTFLSDAWKNNELFKYSSITESRFKVAQLPLNRYRFWQALADEEIDEAINNISQDREKYRDQFSNDKQENELRNVTSVVFHAPGDCFTENQNSISGLLIDKWDEIIPEEKATTGVSFNYNQPGAQAPQTILLAVPKKLNSQFTRRGSWANETEIRDIVCETMDLMNIRGVDLDALKDLGRIFPALFLPPKV